WAVMQRPVCSINCRINLCGSCLINLGYGLSGGRIFHAQGAAIGCRNPLAINKQLLGHTTNHVERLSAPLFGRLAALTYKRMNGCCHLDCNSTPWAINASQAEISDSICLTNSSPLEGAGSSPAVMSVEDTALVARALCTASRSSSMMAGSVPLGACKLPHPDTTIFGKRSAKVGVSGRSGWRDSLATATM